MTESSKKTEKLLAVAEKVYPDAEVKLHFADRNCVVIHYSDTHTSEPFMLQSESESWLFNFNEGRDAEQWKKCVMFYREWLFTKTLKEGFESDLWEALESEEALIDAIYRDVCGGES